jgi:hypothetical protein
MLRFMENRNIPHARGNYLGGQYAVDPPEWSAELEGELPPL